MVARMDGKARGGRFGPTIPRAPAATLPPLREDGVSLVQTANPRARVAPAPIARTNKQMRRAASAVIPPFARNGKAPFHRQPRRSVKPRRSAANVSVNSARSEEHTSELQSHVNLVCRLLLEKKNNISPSGYDVNGTKETYIGKFS